MISQLTILQFRFSQKRVLRGILNHGVYHAKKAVVQSIKNALCAKNEIRKFSSIIQ